MDNDAPIPTTINLHRKSHVLDLGYADGAQFSLSCEYLRVYSPSAEVKGHGPGQEVLQTGKMQVAITAIKPVGNYALQLVFDDGHDTGLYSWDYLYQLCQHQQDWWQDYLARLEAAGQNRDPDVQVIKLGL
jgi:DUF971 family protein